MKKIRPFYIYNRKNLSFLVCIVIHIIHFFLRNKNSNTNEVVNKLNNGLLLSHQKCICFGFEKNIGWKVRIMTFNICVFSPYPHLHHKNVWVRVTHKHIRYGFNFFYSRNLDFGFHPFRLRDLFTKITSIHQLFKFHFQWNEK